MRSEDFDAEKFLKDGCPCGCEKPGRKAILDGIESLKESNPVLSQQLVYYRDEKIKNDKDSYEYSQLRRTIGDDRLETKTVESLRAMADKIESKGMHFILSCKLPTLPICNDGHVAYIEVLLAAGPLGG